MKRSSFLILLLAAAGCAGTPAPKDAENGPIISTDAAVSPTASSGAAKPKATESGASGAPASDNASTSACLPGAVADEDGRCEPCPKGSPASEEDPDQVAACRYVALVKKIPRNLELERVTEGYGGTIDVVKTAYDKDLTDAKTHVYALQEIAAPSKSRAWAIMTRLKQASLYDAPRTKLEMAAPPRLKLFTEKERDLLDKAKASGQQDLLLMAQNLEKNREEMWQAARARWLDAATMTTVRLYADGLLWAKVYRVDSAEIKRGRARFASFEETLDEPKMKEYLTALEDPVSKKPFVYSRGSLSAD